MIPFKYLGLSLVIGISFVSSGFANSERHWGMTTETSSTDSAIMVQAIRRDVPYVPTSKGVVQQMLQMANVTSSDVVYDLGSGDGRIVISAAKTYGSRGVGVEIDPKLVEQATENAQKAGVSDRVKFIQQDLFDTDISEATVVTLYLLPNVNVRLRPKLLRELKPGTRIVSQSFDMGNWQPKQVIETTGGSKIYYWVVPEEIPDYLLK